MADESTVCRVPETDGVPPDDREIGVKYLPDATEEEASRQAFWAYSFGYGMYCNPYQIGTHAYARWNESWRQSQADDGG